MNEAKLGTEMRTRLQAVAIAAEAAETPVIVKYSAPLPGVGVIRALRLPGDEAFGIDHQYGVIAAVAGRATHAQIGALTDDPNVEMVWYDSPVRVLLEVSVPLIG